MQSDENEHDWAHDEVPSEQLINKYIKVSLLYIYFYVILFWEIARLFILQRHNKEGSRCHMMNKNPNVAHEDVPNKQLISI